MLPACKHFANAHEAIAHFQVEIGPVDGLEVLDVGCGRENWLMDTSCGRLTGLDPSHAQLDANLALDERIVGSVETHEAPDWCGKFDVVVASYVLEHLSDPASALVKMTSWLMPGGRLILALPNIRSVKGYVTKYTPLFVHRWFYKLSLGEAAPPEDGGPFPTFMRPLLGLDDLQEFLNEAGLAIDGLVSFESYQNAYLRKFVPAAILDSLNAFLLGPLRRELSPRATDLLLLISKTPERGS